MVDLSRLFWNQVHEQLIVWHKEFHTASIGHTTVTYTEIH
jgi:hypothetical protein